MDVRKLCPGADLVGKVLIFKKEFDRIVEEKEALDRKAKPTPEEGALSELPTKLIQDNDDQLSGPGCSTAKNDPVLMEQRKLRQADLVPSIASRAGLGQAKKLAEFFHTFADLLSDFGPATRSARSAIAAGAGDGGGPAAPTIKLGRHVARYELRLHPASAPPHRSI